MANRTWTGAGDATSWNDAANWDGGVQIPQTGDTVTIPDVAPTDEVILSSGTADIISLDSEEAFTLQGGSTSLIANTVNIDNIFTINGGRLANATVDLVGGTLVFANNNNNRLDAVTLAAPLNLLDSGSRVLLVNGSDFDTTANLSGNSAILGIGDTVTLTGKTINVDGSSAVFGVGGNNTLTLGTGTQVNLSNSSARITSGLFVSGEGTVVNQGKITADGTGSRTINPDVFTNEGTAEAINGAVLFIGGSGRVVTNVSPDTLTDGTWQVFENSTIRLEGANIVKNAATIVLDGAIPTCLATYLEWELMP